MSVTEPMTKLSDLEQSLIKRWLKGRKSGVPDAVKDELRLKFAGEILFDEPMRHHTFIKIGGPADIFLKPKTEEDAVTAVRVARAGDVPVYFHGGGANTLVRDGGIRGCVLCLYDCLNEFSVIAETADHVDISAGAGTPFSKLVHFSRDIAASGLTPLTGIPGCLGGLVCMNAGTREREMRDVVRSVTYLDKDLNRLTLESDKLEFAYRRLKLPRTHLILRAVLRLEKLKSREELDEEIRYYQKRRADTQPLNFPNLGSIFKNPQVSGKGPVVTAGRLVEEAGLKDVRVGGARISPKHANFIINEGTATANDVLSLIDLAREKVRAMAGIELETEIRIVGEDAEPSVRGGAGSCRPGGMEAN